MPYWKSINKIFLYDGTFDGLLTIIFDCYVNKSIPCNIVTEDSYCFNFLDETNFITTNLEKSQRVLHGIDKNISHNALYNAYHAFLCDAPKKELDIVKYIYHGFKVGPQIDNMLSIDYIFSVNAMRKRALGECHRLKGLVRFLELENNIYYASIHPDNNIIELLGHHFVKRLPCQNFMIHDKNRNIAFLYNTHNYQVITDVTLPSITLSYNEKKYEKLWKAFFETVSIKERKNSRLQMQYMPKKYWKDLIEMQEKL